MNTGVIVPPVQPWAGNVTVQFAGPSTATPEGIDWGIDGRWMPRTANAVNIANFMLNTAVLADGAHWLQFASWAWPATGPRQQNPDLTALVMVPFWTANGTARATYQRVPSACPLVVGQPVPRLSATGFPLSMFNLSAAEMGAAGIPPICQIAGLNTYEDQFFLPVFPIAHLSTGAWWNVLALADDTIRTAAMRAAWLADPMAATRATAAVKQLVACGRCAGICTVDESQALILDPANPSDHSAGARLPVTLSVAAALRGLGVPVAWPVTLSSLKASSNIVADAWTSPAIADFACVYTSIPALDPHPWGLVDLTPSMSQVRDCVAFVLDCCPAGTPRMTEIHCEGAFYRPASPYVGRYQPGVDTLVAGAFSPAQILCQVGVALCHGASALRYWTWDSAGLVKARLNPGPGQAVMEGCGPAWPDRWNAVRLANQAVATLAPSLFGPVIAPPDWGSDWETMQRPGAFLAINCTDRALPVPQLPGGFTSAWTLTPAGRFPFSGMGQMLPGGGWVVCQ